MQPPDRITLNLLSSTNPTYPTFLPVTGQSRVNLLARRCDCTSIWQIHKLIHLLAWRTVQYDEKLPRFGRCAILIPCHGLRDDKIWLLNTDTPGSGLVGSARIWLVCVRILMSGSHPSLRSSSHSNSVIFESAVSVVHHVDDPLRQICVGPSAPNATMKNK